MDRLKVLFMVAGIAGAIYWVKSIKISVSGANAVTQEEPELEEVDNLQSNSAPRVNQKPPIEPVAKVKSDFASQLSLEEQLVQLIERKALCEFIQFSKDHSVSQWQQLKALSTSLKEDRFKELEVFAESGAEAFENYQTEMAKTFLIGRELKAFETSSFERKFDFAKGLSTEHQPLLEKIEDLQGMDSRNLLYELFENEIYLRYKNLTDDFKAKIFERIINTNEYRNPIFDTVRGLYDESKNNVVQFFLAQKIFAQSFSIERSLIERSIWWVYDEAMREHIGQLLQRNIESHRISSKVFGYEEGVYRAYRSSLPYDFYEVTPDVKAYERSLIQPTYSLEELKMDSSETCDPDQVRELAIKLRAL